MRTTWTLCEVTFILTFRKLERNKKKQWKVCWFSFVPLNILFSCFGNLFVWVLCVLALVICLFLKYFIRLFSCLFIQLFFSIVCIFVFSIFCFFYCLFPRVFLSFIFGRFFWVPCWDFDKSLMFKLFYRSTDLQKKFESEQKKTAKLKEDLEKTKEESTNLKKVCICIFIHSFFFYFFSYKVYV